MPRHLAGAPAIAPASLASLLLVCTFAGACGNASPVLTQQLEARQLQSELHVQFTKAADASNRAVMADTDESSSDAARDASNAKAIVAKDIAALKAALTELGFQPELKSLDAFATQFAEYRTLDDEILSLAVENTNLKAQRLSFGDAQAASDAIGDALEQAAAAAPARDRSRVDALAAKTRVAVLDIQVLEARHIAESKDEPMTAMETKMRGDEAAARSAVNQLKALVRTGSSAAEASAALDRFKAANDEIVRLSRRNSNVRSLALSMERQRTVTERCEAAIEELEQALAAHGFKGTR